MRKVILILILSIPLRSFLFAQQLRGIITDESKQPIPDVTVFVSNLNTGTSTNVKGEYAIQIPEGSYTILYRSLGYKEKKILVHVSGSAILNIVLEEQTYLIPEVIISKRSEDPANAIMRKVIAWSDYHLNQVNHFNSEIYLKGTLNIDHVPRLLSSRIAVVDNGKEIKLKSGDSFVDESINLINFDAPNHYQHKIFSVHTSYPIKDNHPMTPIDLIKSSLYQKQIYDLISPLSPTAFSDYKFHYEGFKKEGDLLIDKIKVVPLRKSQQLMEGYLYIIEDLWCIYSLELTNEQFWGSMQVKQQYASVLENVWLPVGYHFLIHADYLGINISYNYVATVKLSNIIINEKLKGPLIFREISKDSKLNSTSNKGTTQSNITKKDLMKLLKEQQREHKKHKNDTIKSLEIKDVMNYTIDSLAFKRDTAYWDTIRPIPLLNNEIKTFEKRDSIEASLKNTDSTKIKAKKSFILPLLKKYNWKSENNKFAFNYNGLIKIFSLSFNTVDGWVYDQGAKFTFNPDSMHHFNLNGNLSYAFERKAVMGSIEAQFAYAPLQNGIAFIHFNHNSSDFNTTSGIGTLYNSLSSVLFRYNYMKLYDDIKFSAGNAIDIENGFRLDVGVSIHQFHTLTNHSNFSLFPESMHAYTENLPINKSFTKQDSSVTRSLGFSIGLKYTPEYYYKILHGHKYYQYSNYPTFSFLYKSGLPRMINSQSNYNLISIGIEQKVDLNSSYFDMVNYSIGGGTYLNSYRLHFSEFTHFDTQAEFLSFETFYNSFQLLSYYQNSTCTNYVEAHLNYNTYLLLLKRLPIISNRFWTENLYVNYLYTSTLNNYTEVGYGFGQIGFLGEAGIFAGFDNLKYKSIGIKINIHL